MSPKNLSIKQLKVTHFLLLSEVCRSPSVSLSVSVSLSLSLRLESIIGSNQSFPAASLWNNISWWIDQYGDEIVLCKDTRDGIAVASCSIKETLLSNQSTKKYYIVGETNLFSRHPELEQMLHFHDKKIITELSPGRHIFTQLFMGYGGMGSDVHSALGCNLFHQIVGKKKWTVFPPSQGPYLLPSLNPNGLSVYTMTRLGSGKIGTEPSPWLSKLERYSAILEPGDLFFDAPWFWHGVENISPEEDLVIGVASRYMTPLFSSSFKNNWLLTSLGIASIAKEFGLKKFLSSPESFQQSLETSRNRQAERFKRNTQH
jgi:hypothetical protein